MLQDITSIGVPFVMVGSIVGVVWYMRSWLEKQFHNLKLMIFEKLEELDEKLQYHERHDDQRFHDISNDIWAIKVRNATIDGRTSVAKETRD